MEVIILENAHEVSMRVARMVAALVGSNPAAVLGLATGNTPKRLYTELVRMHREGRVNLSAVTTFNLDEYVGLPPDDPRSYHSYMRDHLFEPLGLPPKRTHIPDGMATDVNAACIQYEDAIRRAGGIDLQILGLGVDGHIGFNEPSSSLGSRTRIKTLTDETLARNRIDFAPEHPPRHVITMGVATILEARHCVLMACGATKAAAVAGMVEGPITAMNPASALQQHPHTSVLIDEDASRDLRLVNYYRAVECNKPAWQRLPGE